MAENAKYTIFRTRWGYFGLLAGKNGLVRSCLPESDYTAARQTLLDGMDNPHLDKGLFPELQQQIIAYFDGSYVNFDQDIPLALDDRTDFTKSILTACRKIPYGQQTCYRDIAKSAGRPKAIRATAKALAANPIPLIIPCHRVIRSDGSIGGFSTPAGPALKTRLLALEST